MANIYSVQTFHFYKKTANQIRYIYSLQEIAYQYNVFGHKLNIYISE